MLPSLLALLLILLLCWYTCSRVLERNSDKMGVAEKCVLFAVATFSLFLSIAVFLLVMAEVARALMP